MEFLCLLSMFKNWRNIMDVIQLNCRCCGCLYEVIIIDNDFIENGFCSFDCSEEFLCII